MGDERASGNDRLDTRIVLGIFASLFVAMTLGAFGILWARLNSFELLLGAHTNILADRGERITKIEGIVGYLNLSNETQAAEHRRMAEEIFQLKLQVYQVTGRKSPP